MVTPVVVVPPLEGQGWHQMTAMKVKEVAETLNVCEATVRRWARDSLIPCRIIKRPTKSVYLFDRATIQRFVVGERHPDAAGTPEIDFAAASRVLKNA